MKFNIVRKNKIQGSFREKNIMGKYDIEDEIVKEKFEGEIILPEKWNIGVIVGPSGTGKSTIAKELFGENFLELNYGNKSIIDEIGKDKTVDEISNVLNKVGFNTPKSWLKPYSVLSNGEKMRVDLANALLSDKEIIIFDEFTSVVDRQVAQYGSFAIQKMVRKENKKFIAVGCHYDILDWLEPDWVFDTKNMSFYLGKMSPNIKDHQLKQKSELDIKKNGNYLVSIII